MRISDWSSDVCSSDLALFGGLLRSPAESTSPVIADQRKVPSSHVRVGGDNVALPQSPNETLLDRDLLAGSHLVRRRDQQAVRMRADVQAKILRAKAIAPHALDLLYKLFGGIGDVGVPVDRIA